MSYLTIEEIAEIKEKIWQGFKHEDIAEHFLLDPSTISRIRTGKMFGYIPWIDGSTGPIPVEREKLLKQVRYEERKRKQTAKVISKNQSPFEQERVDTDKDREPIEPREAETKEDIIDDAVSGLVSTKPIPTARSRSKPLSNTELSELDKLGMELDNMATDNLSQALHMTGDSEPEDEIESAPTIYEKHKWAYVWKLGENIPIVALAESEGDDLLKEAICIVFKGLPVSQWRAGSVPTMIGDIRKQLEDERKEDG